MCTRHRTATAAGTIREAENACDALASALDRAGLRLPSLRLDEGYGAVTRRVFQYVPFTVEQDPTAEPECEALCVSGDEADCGARSGTHSHPGPVEEWQRKHTQETRHLRYRRNFGDYAVLRQDVQARTTGTCEHRKTERRDGRTHCRDCKRQLYL